MGSSLYAIQFSNGMVKVGRATDPVKRIAQHGARFALVDIVIFSSHHRECTGDIGAAETRLILYCGTECKVTLSREWFVGIDFNDVCHAIDSMVTTPAEDNGLDRAIAAMGSQVALAELLSVKTGHIYHWRKSREVPAKYCPTIERATGVRCEDLCPGVDWAFLRQKA